MELLTDELDEVLLAATAGAGAGAGAAAAGCGSGGKGNAAGLTSQLPRDGLVLISFHGGGAARAEAAVTAAGACGAAVSGVTSPRSRRQCL